MNYSVFGHTQAEKSVNRSGTIGDEIIIEDLKRNYIETHGILFQTLIQAQSQLHLIPQIVLKKFCQDNQIPCTQTGLTEYMGMRLENTQQVLGLVPDESKKATEWTFSTITNEDMQNVSLSSTELFQPIPNQRRLLSNQPLRKVKISLLGSIQVKPRLVLLL